MDVDAFHRRLRELYLPPQDRFTEVDVPDIRFAVVDGHGDPAGDAGAAAVRWLYAVVHLFKPLMRERLGRNFVLPPLECLCWADREQDFLEGRKDQWQWRVMVACVDWITRDRFDDAVASVARTRGAAPPTLRLENLHEGRSVQLLHVGDYGGIRGVCDRLYRRYLPEHHLTPNGRYHEIYLNDPARTAPARRRTVIRQPVA